MQCMLSIDGTLLLMGQARHCRLWPCTACSPREGGPKITRALHGAIVRLNDFAGCRRGAGREETEHLDSRLDSRGPDHGPDLRAPLSTEAHGAHPGQFPSSLE